MMWSSALAASLIFLSACRSEPPDVGKSPNDALAEDSAVVSVPDASFDPDTIAVGDSVRGLRIEEAAFRRVFEDSVWVGAATFEGEVTVSGRYATHFDCPGVPEACYPCFYADSASTLRLPRIVGDERYAWFCFTNAEAVEQALGPPPVRDRDSDGPVSEIVIRRYRYVFEFTDTYNEAEFVREGQ